VILGNMLVGMMQSMQDSTDASLFDEAEVRRRAERLRGLTFASMQLVTDARGKGYEATYTFDDIERVRLDQDPSAVLPEGVDRTDDDGDGPMLMDSFRFAFQAARAGTPAALTVTLPRDDEETDDGDGDDADDDEIENLQMVRGMLRDAGLAMTIEVEGRITDTNASFVSDDRQRVTMLELDFERLTRDEAAFRRFMALSERDRPPNPDTLAALPGFAVETQREVTIRFQ
jgi:hypothetical protein